MTESHFTYKFASTFLALSALFHLIAGPLSGWADIGLVLIPVGLLYLLAAAGLLRGRRWLAYLLFPTMLIGAIICYATLGSNIGRPLPNLLWIAIAVADLLCAAALFRLIWRDPRRTREPLRVFR